MNAARSLVLLNCIGGLTLFAEDAAAQITNNPSDRVANQLTKELKGVGLTAGSGAVGYTIMPGIVVTPTASAETGYDSNPNELLSEEGSIYGKTGVGLSLTSVTSDTLFTIAGAGSWLALDDIEGQDNRLAGTFSANYSRVVAPGLTLSAGGLYEHDGHSFVRSGAGGIFTDAIYRTDNVVAFARARGTEVRYLNSPFEDVAPPGFEALFRTETFNSRRYEGSAGALFGASSWIGLYGEAALAEVDYFDQQSIALVDRDAVDTYGKAGLRITFVPSLQMDLGVRANRREFHDDRYDDVSNGYFDASLTWTPSPFFTFTASLDRTLGEPSAPLAIVGDIKSYKAGFRWIPYERWTLATNGRYEKIDEIGDVFRFKTYSLVTELSYSLSNASQLYTGFAYDLVEEENFDTQYDRYRIGAGIRVSLGENTSERIWPQFPRERINLPSGSELTFGLGYSYFDLPSVKMTNIVTTDLDPRVVHRLTDHDGEMHGVRGEVRLDKMATYDFADRRFEFAFDAFYSVHSASDRSACNDDALGLALDCNLANINDFDADEENNTGPFGDLRMTTKRDLHYWGAAVEATPIRGTSYGSIKDHEVVDYSLSPIFFGLGLRGLHEDIELHAIDVSVPDPVDYKADIDTIYWGGYVGLRHSMALGSGTTLTVGGRAGVYRAKTDYNGTYLGYIPGPILGGGAQSYILERGSVDDENTEIAFIGDLGVGLERQFGHWTLGVRGAIEYLSYVPDIRLNNNDEAGGAPFGQVGSQLGTEIGSSDAFNYSLGLSAKVPF